MPGYSTIATTMDIYSHVPLELQRDAARTLQEGLKKYQDREKSTPSELRIKKMSAKWESKNKTGAIRPRFSFANWQERQDSNPRPLVLEFCGGRFTLYQLVYFSAAP
jgi:predicted metal-dependent hydrolase